MSGVEALARVLRTAAGDDERRMILNMSNTRSGRQARNLLADPGQLLAALAEAGIIHPQLCSRSGAACFNGWTGDE